jgi:hypothetical protein
MHCLVLASVFIIYSWGYNRVYKDYNHSHDRLRILVSYNIRIKLEL